MSKKRPVYSAEFRSTMIEQARLGQSLSELARKHGCSHEAIRKWRKQADLDEGLRHDGQTSSARRWSRKIQREIQRQREQLAIQNRITGWLARRGPAGTQEKYQFVKENQRSFKKELMCTMLKVSASGYYAWLKRSPSLRKQRDWELAEVIREGFERTRRCYGPKRLRHELREQGEVTSARRIGRLMVEMGLSVRRKKRKGCTKRNRKARGAPDLVKRKFHASKPNKLWVADITEVLNYERLLYLAMVLEVFSSKVVGWAISSRMPTELVLEALEMAVRERRPRAVVHHSDKGSQYTSLAFGQRSQELGVRPSTGSVGDCYDNAMAESFFATLEKELFSKKKFASCYEARQEVFMYIEGFYNTHRKHSSLNYMSPNAYESKAKEEGLFAEEDREKEAKRVTNLRGLFAEEAGKGMVPLAKGREPQILIATRI